MKRAWPYALALAVVVTGCYLALAPLLRSLSPAPSASAKSPLSLVSNTTTVGKTKSPLVVSPNHGSQGFVGLVKKKAKKKPVKKATTATTTPDTGFAANTPSSSSSSSTPSSSSTTPAKTSTTPKITPKKKGAATVGGGTVRQTPNGDSGLAGGTGSGASQFGQAPTVGN